MSRHFRHQASAASCWLRIVSGIVPRAGRSAWRLRQQSSLHSLRILEARGELPVEASALLTWFCGHVVSDAVLLRYGRFDPRMWLRGPAFLLSATAAFLFFLAVCTHGFAVTRSLLELLHAGNRSDRLIATSMPVVFALACGIIAALGRLRLRPHARHLAFLTIKTFGLCAILVALWTEGGSALRASIPAEIPRALIGGLLLAIAFVAVFVWIVLWSLADQQHRCPVCLRRFVLPVRMGSSASLFEPVTTEWICEAGHGSFCEHETAAASDYWITAPAIRATT